MFTRCTSFIAFLSLINAGFSRAENGVDLEPKIFQCHQAVVSEDFGEQLPSNAVPVKGRWTVSEGALQCVELEADKHAAVLNYQKPNRDSAVRFRFKLTDTSGGFHFSLNHAAGHLFRVVLDSDGVSVKLDKDKKDPSSKAVILANAKQKIAKDQWHTMLIEMKGDQVVTQLSQGVMLDARHPKLAVAKPNYRFVTRGSALLIDDLRIFEK